ncbi:hypothetical protein DFH09DRAFT_1093215 [Mycena vulgaris]|nr:hypothetical protein DFH09DRAFT_1093215 [Mycena vulgaris]
MNERSETPPNTVNRSLTLYYDTTTQSVATPHIFMAKKIDATYFIHSLASTLESTSFPQLEENSDFGHGSATNAHQWHICLALGAKNCFLKSVSSLRVGWSRRTGLERPTGIERAHWDRAGAFGSSGRIRIERVHSDRASTFESSGRIEIERAGLDRARGVESSTLSL